MLSFNIEDSYTQSLLKRSKSKTNTPTHHSDILMYNVRAESNVNFSVGCKQSVICHKPA